MTDSLRLLVAAFGDPGHAFPAIALAKALQARGHEVVVETWEHWREPVEDAGLRFEGAEEYTVFPPPAEGGFAGAAEAAIALRPLLDDLRPDVVVSDILTLAPTLAAEAGGLPARDARAARLSGARARAAVLCLRLDAVADPGRDARRGGRRCRS